MNKTKFIQSLLRGIEVRRKTQPPLRGAWIHTLLVVIHTLLGVIQNLVQNLLVVSHPFLAATQPNIEVH